MTSYAFTATAGTYSSITGISPVLTGDGANPTRDEGYANNIPLGFTFNYLGINYQTIGASTNGFASFGTITTPGFSNSLATGGTGRPLLAPLWEDLALAGAIDLQYTTTGSAGNRVFILQWANVFFDFGANDTSLSVQLRLYETTNVIEFIYTQLPGPVQDYSGGASIGITSGGTGTGNFLSLNNSSNSPTVSSSICTNNIITRPASGQIYSFAPPVCAAPGNVAITNITTTGATLSWSDAAGGTGYEYSVLNTATPPLSGVSSVAGSLPITGLTPGTQYYVHVRTNCGGSFSGWSTIPFVTICEASNIPYTMPISNVVCPALPICTTAEDKNLDGNTWRTYPSAGQGWTDQVVAYVYNINGTTAANDWLYTQGLNLTAGVYYRLKFKYNNDYTTLYSEKLKVAYGNANNSAAMVNILADYPVVYGSTAKTATIDFTPSSSGIWYIGFQAYSDANKDVIILDEISVDLRPACDVPSSLAANVASAGTSATVSWTAPSFGPPTGYEYAVITTATPPVSGTSTNNVSVNVNGLTANAQYYLHVRTNCGGSFSQWTTFAFATIGNDDPCKALSLTAGAAPYCSNTALATTSPDDPYINCSSPDHTVWYKYTATANGTVVLHLTTPAAPANPLHGWVGWYTRSGNCPNISLDEDGYCFEFGNNGNGDVDDLISPVLTAGTTYYLMIDGYSDDVGEFCISVPACSPALAVQVNNIISTSASVSWSGTGSFIIEYGPTGFTPGIDGNAGIGGTIINPAVLPQTISGLTLSTTYDVYVRQNCTAGAHGYSNNSTVKTFTTLGPPPANDNITDAIPLTVFNGVCGGATSGSTLNATPSSTIPLPACGNGAEGYDDDVWYSFTPSAGQIFVTIDFALISGNSDVVAQIYTSSDNTASGTFALFACSDDGGPANMPAFTSLPVTQGTTYFIRVFSYARAVNSQFTICVTKALLINDNASGAIIINVDAGCNGAIFTNVGATQTAGEPTGSCSSTTGYATAWYKFTAPAGGAVRISTAAGSGNTLTNTRVALFQVSDVNDYNMFSIVACDEDGGSGAFGNMSVLYATGLTVGNAYYIQVDKFDAASSEGTFCLTVDKLSSSMLSTNNNCSSNYQAPVGGVSSYTGWVSLMDEDGKLIAQARNTSGAPANAYTVSQNINAGAVRKDLTSGEYYLDRSYTISNSTSGSATVNVLFFFLTSELTALTAVDPAASLSRLRVTRQSAAFCQPDFTGTNGTNSELSQNSNGSANGVSWIRVNTTGFSNFYIHAVKAFLTSKVFLQGAYVSGLSRHKDVTSTWANIMNTFARNQPYNTSAFGNYTGAETVANGFFNSTTDTTNVLDWVLVEIKSSGGSSLAKRAAFVREDGQIVDLDGVSPVSLYGLSTGNDNIYIRHRNHLGIRTPSLRSFTSVALGVAPVTTTYDFTTAQNKAYQNSTITTNPAMKDLGGNTFGMWGGNGNSNNTVRANGPPTLNDYTYLFTTVLAGSTGPGMPNVYQAGDLNLDGTVRASGPISINDFSYLITNVLAGNVGAVITEHL